MNTKRRLIEPTDWKINGELFLNCSCDVFCPCVVSLGAHPPTEGHCHAWMGIIIDKGHFEGENLAGLNVGLLVDIPGRMGEGNWKVAAYVDENATEKAYSGILKIFSGVIPEAIKNLESRGRRSRFSRESRDSCHGQRSAG